MSSMLYSTLLMLLFITSSISNESSKIKIYLKNFFLSIRNFQKNIMLLILSAYTHSNTGVFGLYLVSCKSAVCSNDQKSGLKFQFANVCGVVMSHLLL